MSEQNTQNVSLRVKIEVILIVFAIFLAFFYFFSVGLTAVDYRSSLVALLWDVHHTVYLAMQPEKYTDARQCP